MSELTDPAEFLYPPRPIDPKAFELWFGGSRLERVSAFGGYTLYIVSHSLGVEIPSCPAVQTALEKANEQVLNDRRLQKRTARRDQRIALEVGMGLSQIDNGIVFQDGSIKK